MARYRDGRPGGRGPRTWTDSGLATLARLLRLVARHDIEVVDWNFFPPLTNGYVWALSVLAPRLKHYFTDHNSARGGAAGPSAAGGRCKKRLFKTI